VVGGLRTRYYDTGSGDPPLLLIHGGQFGSLYSLDSWSLNLPEFASHFRVIAYDKPGQGYTDNPRDPGQYEFDTVVRHAAAFCESLGLPAAHVVGHSRGGLLAARLAIERPDLVRTLTLVDSGSAAPADPALPVGAFYAPFESAALWRSSGRRIALAEPRAQAHHQEWITDDFIKRMAAIAKLPKTRAARSTVTEVEMTRWRPSLDHAREATLRHLDEAGLGVPTLVIWGHDDRSAPHQQGERLYERIAARTADAAYVVLKGAGHYVFRDRPHAFASIVSSFCGGWFGCEGRPGQAGSGLPTPENRPLHTKH
jgi:pimeloyl-ACP methyl ester carboxylesterase